MDETYPHLGHARQMMRVGNIDRATQLLRQHLASEPDEPVGHALLSTILLSQKRLTAARYEAEQALALAPEMPLAHDVMGQALMAHREPEAALRHHEAAIALDPNNAHWFESLGDFHRVLDHREAAEGSYLKAQTLAPEEADVPGKLAALKLEAGDPPEAERWARECLTLDPVNRHGLLTMGTLLLMAGDVAGAREHAITVLQRDPTDSGAITLLANIKARQSLLHGIWWRMNAAMMRIDDRRRILVIVGSYLIYRLLVLVFADLGLKEVSVGLSLLWFAFVVYTWVAPRIFLRRLLKELEPTALSRDF